MTQRSENDFPTLTEEGKKQAERLIEGFKVGMARAAERAIGEFYGDILPYIESDAWSNFRQQIVEEVCGYGRTLTRDSLDAKHIRYALLKHHRAEIIEDLNQDHLDRIAQLEKQVAMLQEMRR